MFMYLKIAFGNVIKNRRTSLTILIVVFVCVFMMEFGVGFMDGFRAKITKDFLKETGHIKIYNEKFYKDLDFSVTEYNIPFDNKLLAHIKSVSGVEAVMPEINFGAIANSVDENLECIVKALEPDKDGKNYRRQKKAVISGTFIEGDKDIVMGYLAAKSLHVKLGDSLILLSVSQYGGINAVEGKVAGFTKNNNSQEDESQVICSVALAQKLLSIPGKVTEIKVNITDPAIAQEMAGEIQRLLPKGIITVPWQVGQAFLLSYLKLIDIWVIVMACIVIFAAGMGIINSFLMNILNRMPEFGLLRAMGVSKGQVFSMILTESFMLGVTGTVAGLIPGTLLVKYFETNPLNYEKVFKVMEGTPFGTLDATLGTLLLPASFMIVLLTGVLVSVFASLYPAMLAAGKKPSDIMRVLE